MKTTSRGCAPYIPLQQPGQNRLGRVDHRRPRVRPPQPESMLVLWEKDQRRFLFFWNEKLYKQFIAYNAEKVQRL